MATAIEFDLNTALRLWRERLSESPQFRTENLDELESHLRDSMAALQGKGLSTEESFLIGTRRVGSAAALAPEFAAENGGRGWRNFMRRLSWKYLNKVIHGLVLLYFAVRILRARLLALGLNLGQEVEVLQNNRGLIIIGINGGRVALGRGISQKILAEPAPTPV